LRGLHHRPGLAAVRVRCRQRGHHFLRDPARGRADDWLVLLLGQDRAERGAAVEVGPNDGPMAAKVHGIVDRLCALADMPKPRVAIARSPMPNAFATGRNAKKAVLCVTTSLMDGRLDDRELEGVIAHEMSHVAHKDVAVMTIASFLGIIAGLL